MATTDYTDDREISCQVTELEKTESAGAGSREDDSISSNATLFSFDIKASFMPQINESDIEEDESELYDVECDIVQETFLVERDKLLFSDEQTSSETISEILVAMNIPVCSFLIDQILYVARRVGRSKQYMTRGVIYLTVEIDLPSGFQAMDVDDDNNVDDFELRFVSASKASIEGLEKITVENSTNCVICLDGVLVGSEATRMPCLHLFHSDCIRNWLEKRGACPLCRNEVR